MEDADASSSSTIDGDEEGNVNTDECVPLVQLEDAYEPPEVFDRVCTTPLTELRRTTLRELLRNEATTGFYLLLRTLGPLLRGTIYADIGQNVTVPVEDHARNRSICCLHGHVHLKSESELTDLLPVNTVFVLKEPLLVFSSEQDITVVVGSPSDFVVVGRSHFLYENAEALGWREKTRDRGIQLTLKWKQIGDDLLEKGKHQEAGDSYLFALNNGGDKETNLLLNVNLAECYLAQDCFESAIKHANLALRVRPSNQRALYIAGTALYELRQFREAKPYFESLAGASPPDEYFLGEVSRCDYRLNENKGNVDVERLFRGRLIGPTPIDCGSFVGDLEFRPAPGNERGVFATRDLEPGTLILVEKSLVAIFVPPQFSDHGEVRFLRTVFKTVLKNPQTLGRKLYSLPGGGIQTGENSRTFCDEDRELEPIVDVSRLNEIIYKNMLITTNTVITSPSITYQLYEKALLFRHSCLSNCSLVVYNDVITVRTCSPVQKGEELFLRYYGNRLAFQLKQNSLRRFGLTCCCLLCLLDGMELTGVHVQRGGLRNLFYSEIGVHVIASQAEENLLPIVRQLELAYENRQSLRLLLFFVYCDLAKVVDRTSEDWKLKVTLYVEKGLRSVGLSRVLLLSCAEQVNPQILKYILDPEVLFEYAALMAEVEHSSGRLDFVENWVKVLLFLERIYRGGTLRMLRSRFESTRKISSILLEFAT